VPATATRCTIPQMDAAFIQQNQIIERYLAGKLPLKGAQDFERFCRENPATVTDLGMSDRINAALKLLDASGEPEPWAEKKLPFYQKPLAVAVVTAVAAVLLVTTLLLFAAGGKKDRRIASLTKQVETHPLEPSKSTRVVLIEPSRTGPVSRIAATIGGKNAELAEFKFNLSWSKFSNFRVSIERVDQGRVAILTNLLRDSNGHVRFSLNSSAIGPGDYTLVFEGLDWRGAPTDQAWTRFAVAR
jgi:hypothetical protein